MCDGNQACASCNESKGKNLELWVRTNAFVPWGQKALLEYLTANVRYPDDCEDTCVQGRVIVSFMVERDGSLSEAKVMKSVYPSLDEEALRVVNSMPKWCPGKLNGKAVRIKYTIPVNFKLQ